MPEIFAKSPVYIYIYISGIGSIFIPWILGDGDCFSCYGTSNQKATSGPIRLWSNNGVLIFKYKIKIRKGRMIDYAEDAVMMQMEDDEIEAEAAEDDNDSSGPR